MTRNNFKNQQPLITIITVCFNSKKYIEQCMLSVINQSYSNIEYIVIDGGSNDGTVEIIKRYQEKISYWISEKDHGIYNAMNKGVNLATGKIIYFLNSDDYLTDHDVIQHVADEFVQNNTIDILYGKVEIYDETDGYRQVVGKEMTNNDIKKGFMPPHPALFMKRTIIMENGLFNEKYKIAADFDLIVRVLIKGFRFVFIDRTIATFRLGGLSNQLSSGFLPINEKRNIIKDNFNFFVYLVYSLINLVQYARVSIRYFLSKTRLLGLWRKIKALRYKHG